MENDYELLKEKFGNMIYITEYNNVGKLIINVKHFNIKDFKKKYDIFVDFIYLLCLEALNLSKKNNHNTFTVHINLEQASMRNFSLKLFKKVNAKLTKNLEDVLDIMYIYGSGIFLINIFKIIKSFLDPVTSKKIVIIKQKKVKSKVLL